ncbi:MAG TPA: transporter substrate-binding domain-containing protein [Devosia sp.]|nr:transporter substrate-binding domain-containing protein [Devosia sp.]
MTALFRAGLQWRLLLVAALFVFGPFTAAFAQDKPVLPDEERYGRPSDDFSLRFCVDPRDPGWMFDQAMGEAIAGALLLEPKVHVITDTMVTADFDDIYRHLLGDCSVYFGFKLIAGGYPDWVTVTRAYYQTGYVLVAKAPAPARLADIPPHTALGASMGSTADFRLIQYNNSLPATQRWRRFPMGSDEQALQAVVDDGVAAALVWAPSWFALSKTHPEFAALETVAPEPLTIPPMPVGALLLSRDVFLRTNIDQAIGALIADGTVAKLLANQHMPGEAPH